MTSLPNIPTNLFLHLATHFCRLICIYNLFTMLLFMSTVDTNFFVNLHEFLKAGDRLCRARCRKRRARTLAAMPRMRKAEIVMPRRRASRVSGSRVVVPESLLTPLPRHVMADSCSEHSSRKVLDSNTQ